jgi:hypothetical protein
MSELLKIDVNGHTEKKGALTYLSWAWAWTEVLKIDSGATWEAVEFDGLPAAIMPDTTAMVKVIVTIKGASKSCWLPVMDIKNKAINKPNAMDINKAIMRCLAKAIAMHGLGLYIYAGEDLPEIEPIDYLKAITQADTIDALKSHFKAAWHMTDKSQQAPLKIAYDKRNQELTKETPA